MGYDAGQRGWKLHAIDSEENSFKLLSRKAALCGLLPTHGWSLDLFIEDKCTKCQKILDKSNG